MRFWPFRRRQEQRTISFQNVWGSGGTLKSLSVDSIEQAVTLIPVFAASRLLSDSIASLPMRAFRESGDSRKKIKDPALLRKPTQFGETYDWLHRAVVSLVLRGNAFGLVTARDAFGIPTQIEWLNPDDVDIKDNRAINTPVWYYNGRRVADGDMIHIPWYTVPGYVLGLSPIGAYRTTLETGIHAQEYGRDWFHNGSIPSGVLETDQPVTKEQADIIKARFKKGAEGRDLVVIGSGAHFKPITVMPEEAQFLGTIKATANQIASIYGIPPEKIGGETGSSQTYATTEQQSADFVMYTLRPYLVKLEQAISAVLPRGQYVKFNIDALLRADTAARYAAHHIALTDGWMNRDEIRAMEDMEPLPDGQGQTYVTAPAPAPPAPDPNNPPAPPGTDPNAQGG